jgi:hypothetical protein
MDSSSKLNLDQTRYNRICDDFAHLIIVEDAAISSKQHTSSYIAPTRPGPPFLTVTQNLPEQNNRSRMSRSKLFSQKPSEDSGKIGSFFNFNN